MKQRKKLKKISSVFLIGIVAMLVTMNSCKKEDLVQNESGLVKQQKLTDFPCDIVNFSSFNFDNIVLSEDVKIEEEVTDGAGRNYSIVITNSETQRAAWIAEQEAAGKLVQLCERNGFIIGISLNPISPPTEVFLQNLINLTDFNTDNYVEGEVVDIETTVVIDDDDGNPVCYGIIITSDESKRDTWINEQQALGKHTYQFEHVEIVGWTGTLGNMEPIFVTYYIGISWTWPPSWWLW
jgi:hypothetical protein